MQLELVSCADLLTFSDSKLGNGLVPALVLAGEAIDEAVCKLCLGGCLLSLSNGIVLVFCCLQTVDCVSYCLASI